MKKTGGREYFYFSATCLFSISVSEFRDCSVRLEIVFYAGRHAVVESRCKAGRMGLHLIHTRIYRCVNNIEVKNVERNSEKIQRLELEFAEVCRESECKRNLEFGLYPCSIVGIVGTSAKSELLLFFKFSYFIKT